jgi:hypothetical protein
VLDASLVVPKHQFASTSLLDRKDHLHPVWIPIRLWPIKSIDWTSSAFEPHFSESEQGPRLPSPLLLRLSTGASASPTCPASVPIRPRHARRSVGTLFIASRLLHCRAGRFRQSIAHALASLVTEPRLAWNRPSQDSEAQSRQSLRSALSQEGA